MKISKKKRGEIERTIDIILIVSLIIMQIIGFIAFCLMWYVLPSVGVR